MRPATGVRKVHRGSVVRGATFNEDGADFRQWRLQPGRIRVVGVLRVASDSGEPEGNGVEATRSRFLYREPTIYEEKAKVNDDFLGGRSKKASCLWRFLNCICAPRNGPVRCSGWLRRPSFSC